MAVVILQNTSAGTTSVATYYTFTITVSAGFVYVGNAILDPSKASNQTTAPLLTGVPVSSARVFNEVYLVDGRHIVQLDLPSLAMVTYQSTAGTTPNSNTAVGSYVLTTLAQASGVASAITASATGFQVGDTITIAGVTTAGWNGSYAITTIINSTEFQFAITGNPTTPATVTGNSTASGPYRGNATTCSMACTWRGRFVLAGDSGAPQNFYMSRAGTPTDWNYAATDPAAAVAGNLSSSGLIGEPITALIPFTDDIMLIGCTHSIWMLQGDPADGGTIIPVSSNVGIMGPNAWAKDSFDTLYFLGTNGLYKGRPFWEQWQPPQLLTGENYSQYFENLNPSTNFINMVWDEDSRYIYLFVTPANNSTAGTHLVWDTRNEGLWPIQYQENVGPTAAVLYFADANPVNRGVLIGGWDGILRKTTLNGLADNDNTGTAMACSLTFGPFKPFPEAGLLSGTTIDFGEVIAAQEGSAPVQVQGETPVGTIGGGNTSFNLANGNVLIDSVYLTLNGVQQTQAVNYQIQPGGSINFNVAPASGSILLANYQYQNATSPDPWNVLVTLNAGPDAYEVTEGVAHSTISVACTLERRQKTFRQRLRGGWFSLTVTNPQYATYFSFESALLEFHDAGRNRERR